jgi:hypothetical protein
MRAASTRLRGVLRPGTGPLVRAVDRAESTAVLVCALLAVLLVPVALTIGSLVYRDLAGTAARDATTHHETVAVLTEDVPAAGARGHVVGAAPEVAAGWRLADGTTRTGTVPARRGMTAGETVRVWVDETGAPTGPPLSTADAAGRAVALAAVGWLGAAGLLWLVCQGLRAACERRRMRDWADEWARFGSSGALGPRG